MIELVSAVLVLRRLRAELAGRETGEDAERRVLRVIAVTFSRWPSMRWSAQRWAWLLACARSGLWPESGLPARRC